MPNYVLVYVQCFGESLVHRVHARLVVRSNEFECLDVNIGFELEQSFDPCGEIVPKIDAAVVCIISLQRQQLYEAVVQSKKLYVYSA